MTGAPALVALAILAWPAAGRATGMPPSIYDNHNMFPIGSRAAGMGGAYTALGCDEAALHYNAAALACAGHSRLELSANVYQIQALHTPDAFGKGQDLSATTFHSLPSIVGGVRVLMDGDPDGSGRLVFGLSVEVPHSMAMKADPARPEKPNSISMSIRDDLTTGDIGLAYQFNRYFSMGVGIGAGLRTFEGRYSYLIVADRDVLCLPDGIEGCKEFLANWVDEEGMALGARGKLGIRVTPTPELSLGLAVESPSIDIWGSTTYSDMMGFAVTVGDPVITPNPFLAHAPSPMRLSASTDLGMPFRLAFGAAYSTPGFTLSVDASLNFPRDVDIVYDIEATDIEGFPKLDSEELQDAEMTRHYDWQPNFAIGAEFLVADGVAIDLGLFTDMSAVSDEDVKKYYFDRINMFGASVALGLMDKQVRSWFGASFEYGQAEVEVASESLSLETVFADDGLTYGATAMMNRWTLAGFLGSNYSFFGEPDEDDE